MTRNVRMVVLALIGSASLAMSAAWLVGLLEGKRVREDADYLWQPLAVSDSTWLALGLAATTLAACCIALLRRLSKAGGLARTGTIVLVAIGAIAVYAGVAYGVATEGRAPAADTLS